MKKDIIALVGAGIGGRAILLTLLKIPSIKIKYVCDINPKAPGIILAKNNGIQCCFNDWPEVIANDLEIDLIFEVTGVSNVYKMINKIKPERSILVAAAGTKVIFHLLESQFEIAQRLREYKKTLETRIQERTKELKNANWELELRIKEYEILNKKLQEVNEEKTRYLLQSTHQLKAPFAAIQSYADIIMDGYTGKIPEKTMDIMGKIKSRCEMLSKSIKDMLALANLKTCVRDHLPIEPFSLNKLIQEVINYEEVIAENRKIKLIFKKCQGDDTVYYNRDQFFMLFSVLIENAVNYSYDNSNINIIIRKPSRNKLTVAVSDSGIGITKKNIKRIFNEYFRSNKAVAHHVNGSGLGLSIANEVIRINNFKLDVDSNVGKGSTFTVTLTPC